jgi:hypothetical protein
MNRVGGNSWSTWKHRVSTNKRWFEFRPCLKPEIPVVSDIFAGNQVWHHQTVLRCSDRHENMNLSWYLSISTVQGPIGAQSTGYFISPQKPKNKPMSPKLGFLARGNRGNVPKLWLSSYSTWTGGPIFHISTWSWEDLQANHEGKGRWDDVSEWACFVSRESWMGIQTTCYWDLPIISFACT